MDRKSKLIRFHTSLRDQLNTQTYSLLLGHQTLQLSHWLNQHHNKIKDISAGKYKMERNIKLTREKEFKDEVKAKPQPAR
jgi:hypothetical protein